MSFVISAGDGFRVHTKGASEIVLDLCDTILTEDGTVKPLTPEMRHELRDVIEDYAKQSLRTLSLAYKYVVRMTCSLLSHVLPTSCTSFALVVLVWAMSMSCGGRPAGEGCVHECRSYSLGICI